MSKRHVVVRLNKSTFPVIEEERKILSSINAEVIEIEGASDEEIISNAKEADAIMIVSAYLRDNVIRQLPDLKIISRLGIGYDKINIDEATKQGIVVTNVPDFCTDEVADHTIALMLAVARQLKEQDTCMRQGKRHDDIKNVHKLSSQKLGIIGFGRIGKAIAKRAKGFGMQILAFDKMLTKETAQAEGVELVDFDTILSESDFLSLMCPLTTDTREMLKMKEFKKMKPSAVLVNTGRGDLINESDLVEALKTKVIRYAALDVFSGIPVLSENGFPVTHPFFELENVLLSPHAAATSNEAFSDVKVRGAQAVVDVLSGKYPKYIVNPDVQPKIKLT